MVFNRVSYLHPWDDVGNIMGIIVGILWELLWEYYYGIIMGKLIVLSCSMSIEQYHNTS